MIYLDYNGSTPVDPRVAKLVEATSADFANPASIQHRAGQDAAEALEEARHRVGQFVSRPPRDVIFTSGASEAAALGIIGAVLGNPERPNAVISATEHKAISAAATTATRLSRGEVRTARVLPTGEVDLDHLASLCDSSVGLVIIMAANNETGVINPVVDASEAAHNAGALFFSDATQAAGKTSIAPAAENADLFVFSSHKVYGPKGAGALIIDRHVQKTLFPIMSGGGQERGLRGGTQNTPAIAGFGLATEIADAELEHETGRLGGLTDWLLHHLQQALPDVIVNSGDADRLSNTLNLRFVGADADAVMASMPDVAVSSGSACQAAVPTQSHVLQAMGLTEAAAAESLRISVGRPTTQNEVAIAAQQIINAVLRIRSLAA